MGAVKDASMGIASALKEFAIAIEAFWIALRVQVADAINALISVIANFDPLKAWQGAASLIAGLTNVVDGLWRSLKEKYLEFGKVVSQLRIEDANHQGTMLESWPGPHREFYRPAWTPGGE